jgi:hypothetical protein
VKPIPRVRWMVEFISSRIADIIAAIALSSTAAFLTNRVSGSAKRCARFLFAARTLAHPHERPRDLNVYGNRAFS